MLDIKNSEFSLKVVILKKKIYLILEVSNLFNLSFLLLLNLLFTILADLFFILIASFYRVHNFFCSIFCFVCLFFIY